MRVLEDIERDVADLAPAPWEMNWDGTLGRCTVRGPGLTIHIERPGYGNIPPEGVFIANAELERLRMIEAAAEEAKREEDNSWVSLKTNIRIKRDGTEVEVYDPLIFRWISHPADQIYEVRGYRACLKAHGLEPGKALAALEADNETE